MATTVPWVKFADPGESDAFAANCFPVRGLLQSADDGDGAWLVSQRAEQRRRFKAVLCAKPRTYSRIKEERKKAEREGTQITMAVQSLAEDEMEEEDEAPVLDGFFLMKHCCVEDPSDLCSVNISGQEMSEVKEDDLALFDNVAYVNAAENFLPFEAFRGFPILRELEMPINGLRGVKLQNGDYPYLEMLDLSYNNLSQDDLLTLGTLPNLKILHLTGNNFHTIPADFALPYMDRETKTRILRYSKLEILMLDDNRLSDVAVFAALAGLKRLKHLNLEKNDIYYVPQLKSVEGTMIINDDEKSTRRLQRSARLSARKSARGQKTQKQDPQPEKAERQHPPPEKVESQQTSVPETKKEESPKDPKPTESTDLFASFQDVGAEFGDLSEAIKDIELQESEPIDEESSRLPPDESKSSHSKDKVVSKEPPVPLTSSLPPFPELAYLNLAHNQIAEEEALLAVAAWPMLVELVIHNNPLTSSHSGDPPLLKRFLTARLGIKLVRKVQTPKSKPQVVVPPKRKRKISSIVPKIPKLTMEERLMLEPPPPKEEKSRTIDGLDLHQAPLPPIASKTEEPEETPPSPQYNKLFDTESTHAETPEITIYVPQTPNYGRMQEQNPPVPSSSSVPPSANYSRMQSPPEGTSTIPPSATYSRMQSPPEESSTVPPSAVYSRMQSPPEESSTVPPSAVYSRMQSPPEATSSVPQSAVYSRMMSNEEEATDADGKKDEKGAAFFMTQVDEPEDESKTAPAVRPKRKEKSEKRPKRKDVPDKYKGYEILLDVEEDPDFHAPKDMQGNIKALKYALNHELVYRDSAALLHKVGKPVPPYQKWQMPPQPPRKSKQQRVDEVLENLKNRSTTEEANLGSVLRDNRKMKKFNQAPVLLSEIQSRYNAVRVSSMKEAKEAKKAMQDLKNLANNRPLSIK
uniref:X-ray radiation resistance-associated protein 1-like n=1 Tax=Crassostrea virginica TaxID=6565 RepID=A0A8B8AD25_CRAVI|nr:X-ray radiation resistance-associated protein 1-like [Crassostrea virginica]